MTLKKQVLILMIFIGQFPLSSQNNFNETLVKLINDDFSFYISVKVTDGDRRATLILPWEQLHFALKTADTTLSNEIFLTNLKKNLAGNFEFTLDTSTFHRLSIEFEFHSEKCNGSESAQDIMNKYFDSDGFIKRSLNSVTRACAINKLFSSQIVVFQDDFSGYYMLDKNAKTKTP